MGYCFGRAPPPGRRIEQLEGPDRQAILIIDMMHATTPRLEELQAQVRRLLCNHSRGEVV